MNISDKVLNREEKAIYKLRELYENYGYKRYKMQKFEEYDLYMENRSFLKSSDIITFNDLNGSLMALKPDVTLSIAKNANTDDTEKLYYNENVYRPGQSRDEYKEIMQVGLEYIGEADIYSLCEVITLAKKSLSKISDQYIIDLSHMGMVEGLLESEQMSHKTKEMLIGCIGQKNSAEAEKICIAKNLSASFSEKITLLASLYGDFESTLIKAEALIVNERTKKAMDELKALYAALKATEMTECVNLDFSIVNNLTYYNGFIFQGFIKGVPSSILSGGQYGNLIRKLGKDSDAIGFALYIDLLEQFDEETEKYDSEVLLIYDDKSDISLISKTAQALNAQGKRVNVQRNIPKNKKYKETVYMNESEAL